MSAKMDQMNETLDVDGGERKDQGWVNSWEEMEAKWKKYVNLWLNV
jgi:hypothetical protein